MTGKKQEVPVWISGYCSGGVLHDRCLGGYTKGDGTEVPCTCSCHKPTHCSCGNAFDGDNLCMPSACQWEGIERSVEPSADEALRETIATAIYAGGDEAEWLTTEDGSPNAASYELADRVLTALAAL